MSGTFPLKISIMESVYHGYSSRTTMGNYADVNRTFALGIILLSVFYKNTATIAKTFGVSIAGEILMSASSTMDRGVRIDGGLQTESSILLLLIYLPLICHDSPYTPTATVKALVTS